MTKIIQFDRANYMKETFVNIRPNSFRLIVFIEEHLKSVNGSLHRYAYLLSLQLCLNMSMNL